MNFFEKFLLALQTEMVTPLPYGWYHWLWIVIGIVAVTVLVLLKKYGKEIPLNVILGVFGFVALATEVLKQVSWSFNYDAATGITTWDYQWYAAPYQFCSTPIYVSLIALFAKPGKFRDGLLSYLAFTTIIGGLMTMLIPDSCFCGDILVNIHTMWLHCGGLVVSLYLLISKTVRPTKTSWLSSAVVFLVMAAIALALNFGVYHSGILGDETFNMFYISPYFISVLPVFDTIQQSVPYPVFLALYLVAMLLASQIVFWCAKLPPLGVHKCKQRDILHSR